MKTLAELLAERDALLATVTESGMTDDLRERLTALEGELAQARSDETLVANLRSAGPTAGAQVVTRVDATPGVTVDTRTDDEPQIDTRSNLQAWVERGNQGVATVRATVLTPATGGAARPAYEGIKPLAAPIVDFLALVPSRDLNATKVEYTVEVPKGGVIPTKAEGEQYTEVDFEMTLVSEVPSKIPAFTNVSEDALENVSELEGLIDTNLRNKIRESGNRQLLAGDGTGSNLRGVLNRTGIQSYVAPAGEHKIQSLIKAKKDGYKVSRVPVTHALVSLDEWAEIEWILINEFKATISPQDGVSYRVAGLTVTPIVDIPAGHAVCGAFTNDAVLEFRPKKDVKVDKTNSHGSNFTAGIATLRGVWEGGLAVYKPTNIVDVTFATA